MSIYWIFLFLAVVANVLTNISFKLAAQDIQPPFDFNSIKMIIGNQWIWLGFLSGLMLLFFYIIAIRKIDLGIAYPTVTGMAMFGIVVAGYAVFQETLSVQKIIGIALIIGGIVLLGGSKTGLAG